MYLMYRTTYVPMAGPNNVFFPQVLSADFWLSPECMTSLDTLHLRQPSRKLVNRDRISNSLEEESRGRGREDGYKLRAPGLVNVFPANLNPLQPAKALRGIA